MRTRGDAAEAEPSSVRRRVGSRRTLAIATSLIVILVVGLGFLASRSSGEQHVVTVTGPDTTTTTASGSTAVPPTSTDAPTAPTSEPPPPVVNVPTSTAPPATAVPTITAKTAPTTAVTPTTSPPGTDPPVAPTAPPRPIVAVTTSGDAVYFPLAGGDPVMVFDGPEPSNDVHSPSTVDAVAVTPDEQVAFIGTCCEPIFGTILRADLPGTAGYQNQDHNLTGYGPSISPNGRYVAVGQISGETAVVDIATGVALTGAQPSEENFSPYDTIWLDEHHIYTIGFADPGWVVHAITIIDGRLESGDPIPVPDPATGLYVFAGVVGPGEFALHEPGSGQLVVVSVGDSSGSTRIEPLDEPTRSVWLQPNGDRITVTTDGTLFAGDFLLPGTYTSARR